MPLPSFLEPLDSLHHDNAEYRHATHKMSLGTVHSLWWPTRSGNVPDTVILFKPGNPGLVEFYVPFLSVIREKYHSNNLAILAHSHLGHSFALPYSHCGLSSQVQGGIEAVDALVGYYGKSVRIVIITHSIGCWISLQVLKARPENIANLHLITPTIRHIADTPNGRSLSWLFHPLPRIVASKLTSIFGTYIPTFLLKVLFWDWPAHQITVLQRLLNSPESVLACLEMSHDEMQSVKEADFEFIASHDNRIRIYFAGKDGWVGKHKQVIMTELKTYFSTYRCRRRPRCSSRLLHQSQSTGCSTMPSMARRFVIDLFYDRTTKCNLY
ncbi:hypothetical protein EV421DRAFT_78417 [Armillaria borealis]|uniref:Alpha/beta-hydrolase n=1 Tax=Armillaria borealis TaxID=47425 RepID=A0AA39K8P2_9AGAR|nr:hypothetical protein EV421DRAFT_78417 [Armillaria borealis]